MIVQKHPSMRQGSLSFALEEVGLLNLTTFKSPTVSFMNSTLKQSCSRPFCKKDGSLNLRSCLWLNQTSEWTKNPNARLPHPISMFHRYLAAVLEFTEELSRLAVRRATERDVAAVQRCRDIVDSIHGQFLQVGLKCFQLLAFYSSRLLAV